MRVWLETTLRLEVEVGDELEDDLADYVKEYLDVNMDASIYAEVTDYELTGLHVEEPA